ncbi:MAG: hypothetical protein ACE5LU_07575 [Anaerolineae bacterium]
MELLRSEDVASVILFDIRLSEGEIEAFATAVAYMLDTLDDAHLHAVFNHDGEPDLETPLETRQFLETTLQELMNLIQEHCYVEYLPRRFRERSVAMVDAVQEG